MIGLITGCTGFIGSNLVRHPQMKWWFELVGTGSSNEQDVDVEIVSNWNCLDKIDFLVHLGANNDTQNMDEKAMFEDNYHDPIKMFQCFYDSGCRKFIWASSGACVDNLTPYARSKSEFEKWCGEWSVDKDISCIGFRFSNVWSIDGTESHKGKRASMVSQIYNNIKNDISPKLFKGFPKRDFIHVNDVVSCIFNSIYADVNGVYNLGSGISVSFEDVVNYCNSLLKKNIKPEYIDCPFSETYQWSTLMDIQETKNIFKWEPKVFIN